MDLRPHRHRLGARGPPLTIATGLAGDNLGSSVSIDGGVLLAGAPNQKVGSLLNEGAVYGWHLKNGGWVLDTSVDPVKGSGAQAGDNVGYAVALSGQRAIIGAPQLLGRSPYQVGAINTSGQGEVFIRQVSPPVTVTVADNQQTLIAGAKANIVSGTLGGVQTADLKFFDIGAVSLTTGSAADSITVGAGGLTAFGLHSFTLNTGAGNDTVTVLSDKLTPPAVGSFVPTGAFVNGVPQYSIVAGGFNVDEGSGSNNFVATADTDWTLAPGVLTSGSGGIVSIANAAAIAVNGGAGSNKIHIIGWNGTVVVDGGQGSDLFQIDAAAVGVVTLADSGGTLDSLSIAGTSGNDTFSVNANQINLGIQALAYSGIDVLSLSGGAGDDVFVVSDSSAQKVLLDGEAGSDTYRVFGGATSPQVVVHDGGPLPSGGLNVDRLEVPSSASAGTNSFNVAGKAVTYDSTIEQIGLAQITPILTVTGTSGSDVYQINGSTLTVNGTSIDLSTVVDLTLDGGSGDDTFVLANLAALPPNLKGHIHLKGGGGNDSVVDLTPGTTWTFTGAGTGTVGGADVFSFADIENVTTGDGNDSFVFSGAGASLAGNLITGAGTDTLDDSGLTGPVRVDLGQGTATGIGGTFTGLDAFIGSASGGDTLVGPNSGNLWTLTGAGSGNVNGSIAFSSFENLTGGSGADDFEIGAGAAMPAAIDGGAGANTLGLTLGNGNDVVTVNAASVVINGASVQYANIGTLNVDTAGGNDSITVNAPSGALPQNLQLHGGSGDDTITVALAVGASNTIGVDGGGQTSGDTLVVLGTSADETIAVTATGVDSGGVHVAASDIENVTVNAGTGNDTLTASGVSLSGRLQLLGGVGNDSVVVTGPIVAAGVVVDGAAGTNSLTVATGSGDDTVSIGASIITISGAPSVQYANIATLEVDTQAGADTVTVTSPSAADLTVDTGDGNDAITVVSSAAALHLRAGSGADAVNLQAIAGATNVDLGDGDDTLTVSSTAPGTSGVLTGIAATLDLTGGNGNDRLVLDATGAIVGLTGTITPTRIDGLGMAAGLTDNGFESLDVGTGSGADTVTIAGTLAGSTTLHTGAGADHVIVNETEGSATIDTGADADTIDVTIHDPAETPPLPDSPISGLLTLAGGTGTDTVNLLSGSALDSVGAMSATTVTGLGMPQGIVYAGVEALNLTLGAGNDTFVVASTAAGTATVLTTGAGNDTIDVLATSAPLTVNAGLGDDVVNVGSLMPTLGGTVNAIGALLTVNGEGGNDTLNVDDSGDTIANTGVLTSTSLVGLGMTGGIAYGTFEALAIGLGSANDTFSIASTSTGTTTLGEGGGSDTLNIQSVAGATTVNAGSGDDVVNVGSLAPSIGGNVNAIGALLTVNGEAGNDTLNVDDSGDTLANVGTLTATSVTGLGMAAGLTYANFEALAIGLGAGADTFTIASTQAGTTTLNTNAGADTVIVQSTSGTTTINTGADNDAVDVRAIGAALAVNAGLGDDTVNVGSLSPALGGNVNAIGALLTVNGEAGNDTLNVDDSGDSAANVGTLTATSLTGLGMTSGLNYATFEALAINLGAGADTFTIASTQAGATTLNTNAGADTVIVQSTSGATTVNTGADNDTVDVRAIGAALIVNAGLGDDTVNVGSLSPALGGNVNAIGALLTVNGEAGNDTLNVDDSGDSAANVGTLTATSLTGLGMATGLSYGSFEALNLGLGAGADTFTIASTQTGTTTLNAGAGSDTVNVLSTAGATTVNAGLGDDTVNVGSLAPAIGGNVNAIGALLTVNGEGGNDTLDVDDSGDTLANTGTLTATTLTGLGMTTGLTYGTFEALTIGLGAGVDTFTIASTQTGTTTLNAGAGNDTINVRSTAGTTTVNAGLGDDTVNVGSLAPAIGGNVNAIGALLIVNGEGGNDTLNVDDSGDSAANTGTLTATSLTGLGLASGLNYGSFEALTIGLGAGADTFTIASTQAGATTLNSGAGADTVTVLSTAGVATVNTGTDNDTVNVLAIGAALTVNAGLGDDTVNVGSLAPAVGGNVNAIGALLTVNGEGGNDTLNVDDSGDTLANTGTLTATTLTGLGMTTGLTYGTLEALTIGLGAGADIFTIASTQTGTTSLNAGAGNDTVNVQSTAGATTVSAGLGDDTVNVGSLAPAIGGNVNAIGASLTVNGEGGNDTFNVDDSGDTLANAGTLTATTLTGLGMASGLTYGSFEALAIGLGAGADSFTVASTQAGTTLLNTGAGADTVTVQSTAGVTTVNTGADNDTVNIRAIGAALTLNAGLGDDTVNVGSLLPALGGNVNAIGALLTVNGEAGNDTLNVDDSGDLPANVGTLTATALTGLGMATGLNYATFEALVIGLGAGADSFTIASTQAGTTTLNTNAGADTVIVQSTSGATTVSTGADNDTVDVRAIGAALTVNAGLGDDTVNVGSLAPVVGGNVNAIGALLTVNGEAGNDTINVDDSGDSTANTGTLTATTLTGLGMTSGVAYGTLEALNIALGSGVNTFTIASTQAGTTTLGAGGGNDVVNVQSVAGATTVNAGLGDDVVNVGTLSPATGGNVNAIGALLTVNGEGGNDTLNVDDSGDLPANTGVLTSTTLTGLGMTTGLTYGTFEALTIGLGAGADVFTIASTQAGTTTLNTNAGADTVTVLSTAGVTTVNTGADNDTVNLRAIGAALTVNAGLGDDTVNVGSLAPAVGGNVNAIGALVTVNGETGSDTLNVDDSGDLPANTGVLTSTTLTGLGMTTGLTYATFEALTIGLGAGADVFTIASTQAGTTTLNTNAGADTVTVLSTAGVTTVNTGADNDTVNLRAIGAALTVNAGLGDDTVNVGSLAPAVGGNVNAIGALLTVNGEAGNDTLNVDDSSDTAANTGGLTSTTLTGLGMTAGIAYGTFEALTIGLGAGNDTFTIASTQAATATTLNANAGNDILSVQSTAGATTVNAGLGDDTVNVGSLAPAGGGTLAGIGGVLTLNGNAGTDRLTLDDSGDLSPRSTVITAGGVSGLGMPGSIAYGTFEGFGLNFGNGGNTVSVQSLATALTLNTGAGDDAVKIGSVAPGLGGTLNAINAPITVNGQGGNDSLSLDDTGDGAANTGALTATTITGLGMTGGGVAYANIESVEVSLGAGGNTFAITGTTSRNDFRTITQVNTGAGNDIVTVAINAAVDGALAVNLQAGNDSLDASASTGSVIAFGGEGNDTLIGGSGNDILFGDRGTVDYFNASGVLVTRLGVAPVDRSSDPTNARYVPLKATDGSVAVTRRFATSDPTLGGDDSVFGGAGNDVLFGGLGRDILQGQVGDDTLVGDLGNVVEKTGVVTLTDLTLGGDDILIGGLGNDGLYGGPGNDVMLGGVGQVVRTWNTDGSVRRTDVLLLDVATLTKSIALAGSSVPSNDPATVNALINADLVLLTGVTNADGSRRLVNGVWDTRALLLALQRDGNDTLYGGDGNDAMFGQMGNDILSGEAGNDFIAGGTGNDRIDGGIGDDTLVGDDASIDGTNSTTAPTVPFVTHGLLLVSAPGSADAALGFALGANGTVIVPMIEVVPGRDINAATSVLPQIAGTNPLIPADNTLKTTTAGLSVVPYVSIVPDFVHHLDLLPGNDVITGGDGNDLLVGDDLVVSSPNVSFNAAVAAKAETVTKAGYALSASWTDLVHRQYNGNWTLFNDAAGDPVVVDRLVVIGEDALDGGTGNDLIVGDNSIEVAPNILLNTSVSDSFRLYEQGMQSIGDELSNGTNDLIQLEHRLRDKTVQVSVGFLKIAHTQHHIDAISMGNDTITAGDDNDLVVGDALVVRAPLVTLTGTVASPGKADNLWSNTESWSSRGERSLSWLLRGWSSHTAGQSDYVVVGADTIDGGNGNDLVWGDSVVLLSATVRAAPGVNVYGLPYLLAAADANQALAALNTTVSETQRWFDYSDCINILANYSRTVTWANTADRDWLISHGRVAEDADTITGGAGNDVIYGQDGADYLNGGLGDDWLIGGGGTFLNADTLVGGGGNDRGSFGDVYSPTLNALIRTMMPTWSGAFTPTGLQVVPFSSNTQSISDHPCVDFDVLSFIASPWAANTPLPTASLPDALAATLPAGAAPSSSASSWLDDFILYGGQSATDRNPNDALTVRL